jgi:hypothetical protein
MEIAHSVAQILTGHVTLEVESIDRMYLNLYVPRLQHERGVVGFFRHHRGHRFTSSALMAPISKDFVKAIDALVKRAGVPLISFEKGQRKDEVALAHLAGFTGDEGVLFVGKAQEKTPVFRTEKRRNAHTGQSYAWLVRSTAMVNHYYFYCVDHDFGPFFLKFGSYFPYTAKLCLNGHEYAKRQLRRRGIPFEPLDNGILRCADPAQLQAICDGLGAEQIAALALKWLGRLPDPFSAADHAAGYNYTCSILQAEFSLTQVLDRPLTGRHFFEEVIRENLDIGRPDHVQLLFERRLTKRTPGRFRTRVLTTGVIPSLHVDYKHTRIKQYHKEGRALRTETTINNPRDFRIGKRLWNLPQLRRIGFQANRRLLDVQRISHDCAIGEAAFTQLTQPVTVDGQRASALRFGDPMVQALLSTLVLFVLAPEGFRSHELRARLAQLLGVPPSAMTPGKMTYQLRRLRLHGLIERRPKTHRYRVTPHGLRVALFFTRSIARLIRPGLSRIMPEAPPGPDPLRRRLERLQIAIDRYTSNAKLAA